MEYTQIRYVKFGKLKNKGACVSSLLLRLLIALPLYHESRRSGEALFDNVEAAGLARRGLLGLEGPTMNDRGGLRHGQKGVLKY